MSFVYVKGEMTSPGSRLHFGNGSSSTLMFVCGLSFMVKEEGAWVCEIPMAMYMIVGATDVGRRTCDANANRTLKKLGPQVVMAEEGRIFPKHVMKVVPFIDLQGREDRKDAVA